jgi:hypothetical protein
MKYSSREKHSRKLSQSALFEGTGIQLRNGKIRHQEILRVDANFCNFINTYRDKVLSQKTRTIRLLGRKGPAKVIHTLLGYEVQASYKRIQCPDLVTARYLRLFSEIGCRSIQLPYDPTLTAQLIPELEAMAAGITKKIGELFAPDPKFHVYAVQKAYAFLRQQIRSL